ncbi:M14 family metallopeptidase [Undibacterium danionis]|uniref:M14 family metallopeptidase n=1 Tax=Undibacterium danionis TaxID=1812100 RepID=A0ABV6IB32_9BURK
MVRPLKRSALQLSLQLSLSLCIGATSLPSFAASPSYSDYRSFETIEKQLQSLAQKYPERIKLQSVGKSAGGRSLYFVQIAGSGKVTADKRPALFVGANIAGFHHAGSEAAMHLINTLANSNEKKVEELLSKRTIYVAPILNPDAHNGLFATPRQLRAGNDSKLDRDLDGLVAEDGADDLDGNGIITQMRIKDPSGDMIIDPKDPRRMIKADVSKGERGTHRVFIEGKDDDKDGVYNEDGIGGVHPDRNFPAGFPVADTSAGAWPGVTPEAKATMDAVLSHKNIAMAVVFGPANQLLSAPTGFDRITPPGATPAAEANKLEADDLKVLANLGDAYKKSLDQAGLDSKRSAKQTGKGSLANWLYFHYGVQTIELDVWGAPVAKAAAPDANAAPAPASVASTSGNASRPNAANPSAKTSDAEKDLISYLSANAPESIIAWKKIKLPDGTEVEVGGLDPYAEYAPTAKVLEPALKVHTEQILNWGEKLAQLEILETKAVAKGDDVWQITAIGGMQGEFPTHSKLATRMRNKLPVRLEMRPGKGVTALTLNRAATVERLEPASTIKGEWLVKGAAGSTITVGLWTDQAGQALTTITLGKAN